MFDVRLVLSGTVSYHHTMRFSEEWICHSIPAGLLLGGEVGLSCSSCLPNGICSVEPDAMIAKEGSRFFHSIFHQNTLLKISQTKTKCSQESSSGRK